MSTDINTTSEADMSNGQTTLRRQPRTRRVVMAILFAVLIVGSSGYFTGQALAG